LVRVDFFRITYSSEEMDPNGKGIVINDKETLNIDEPKGDKPIDSGSNNKTKDGKKRPIKKII
jgi:hypothetical protein